jgi:hypothetical protein
MKNDDEVWTFDFLLCLLHENKVFWTPRARIFLRSLLLGAGQVGRWEFGKGE